MKYLLDTDTCVLWLRGNATVRTRFHETDPGDRAVSIITLAELWYGAAYSVRSDANEKAVLDFIEGVKLLDVSYDHALRFGVLKVELRQKGMLIEDFDLLIAAIAVSSALILGNYSAS